VIVASVDHCQMGTSEQRDTSAFNGHQIRFDYALSRDESLK
jgi:hypothetical protein